ncbi:hypothetical protein RE428_27070 [Marinobacter nanhaiticus D15-8W]|uniref:Uncharacterized protein n=1 Tax=Marinobacter nanhaiticus D15-8W TaxID=626887 RepID=N6WRY5_9GAMM|nr:hypothetical protein [Marinobacter nanhaiticus]ENO14301.1 hypothetical protein J057_22945 [Marinobacter nanhaiticus D15-8W]BES71689.1 hypothetical protein RE428_27070 [Marinobacter nanhaiticus D15-8W]
MRLFALPILAATFLMAQPAHSWTISADFDSGPLGSKADRGGDGFHGAGGNSVYTDEHALKGHAAKLTIEDGSTGYGGWGGEFIFPEKLTKGDTVWYQVHVYVPESFDHYSYGEGGRLKFMRIQTKSKENKNHGYLDFLIDKKNDPNAFKWIYEGEQVWQNIGNPEDLIVKGRWESYQMEATLDNVPVDAGGQAEVRIWKNGVLLKHITGRKTLREPTDFSDRALLFTYWNGGAPKTQSLYVDEITITNEKPSNLDTFGHPLVRNLLDGRSPPGTIESLRIE